MIPSNTPDYPFFNPLCCILSEAFQTNAILFTPPYEEFFKIDKNIQKMIEQDLKRNPNPLHIYLADPKRNIFILRNNLNLYNIFLYLNQSETPDFISIGPFFCEDISKAKIPPELELTPETQKNLHIFWEHIPRVALPSLYNVMIEVISMSQPEFRNVNPHYVEYNNNLELLLCDNQVFQNIMDDYSQLYQKDLAAFFHSLKTGSQDLAQKAYNDFLKNSGLLSSRNFTDCKKNLDLLNNYFQIALLNSTVHPTHVLKLHNFFKIRIYRIHTKEQVSIFAEDMFLKYYNLIKKYTFPEYSKKIKDIVDYIHLHLNEDLTLSFLAAHFGLNPNLLSNTFSKEVGEPLTNYIHKIRIQEAIRYFDTTSLSVSKVALMVGFTNFSYFSTLFRKYVGCSPRNYCKEKPNHDGTTSIYNFFTSTNG